MGKGTLITSPTTFKLLAVMADSSLTGTYAGNVYVACNEEGDPDQASPFPLVQHPLPPGVGYGDFVLFEHILLPHQGGRRNRRVVRVIGKTIPNCDKVLLEVTIVKSTPPKVIKRKPVPPKKAKKAVKKKK